MSNRCLFFLFIFCWFSVFISSPSTFGQDRVPVDSLEKFIKTARDDTVKLSALNTITNNYAKKDPEKALNYAWEALRIARELNLKRKMAEVYGNIGYIYKHQGNYEDALEYRLKVSKIHEETDDKSNLGFALGEIGSLYREKGEYEKALEYHLKASKIFEELGDKNGLGFSLDNIGGIYRELGNYEKALEFHLKASKFKEEIGDKRGLGYSYDNIGRIYKEQRNYEKALEFHIKGVKFKEETGDKRGMSYTFGEIGNIYSEQGIYDKALEFHFKALKIREETDDKRALGYTLSFIGKIFSKQGNYEKALEYYLQSSSLCEEIGNKKGLGTAYDQIGTIYADQERYEIALAYQRKAVKISEEMGNKRGLVYSLRNIGNTYVSQAQYNRALEYQNKSLQIAKETGSQTLIRDSYQAISSAYSLMNDYQNALEYYQLYTATKDSIRSETSVNQMAEMQSKYEGEKKDKEISLLKKDTEIKDAEAKKQRILLFSSLFAFILVSALAFLLFNRFKLKRKANEQLEQLNSKLAETNGKITESINYALRIQQSILPTPKLILKYFPQSFVMYKPKDVVSGDFPWMFKKGDDYYIAAVDCTGHGVPGAFMSIIGHSLLNEIVRDKNIEDPAEILISLHEGVNLTLKQTEEDSKSNDGMEVALCKINFKKQLVEFSGANRPLYFLNNAELIQYNGDSIPIGGNDYKIRLRKKLKKNNAESEHSDHPIEIKFTNHKIKFKKNDAIFLFSDGLPDQFGGPKGLKYGPKQIKEKIMDNQHLSMYELSDFFNAEFEEWKGSSKQIDDILFIGVKF